MPTKRGHATREAREWLQPLGGETRKFTPLTFLQRDVADDGQPLHLLDGVRQAIGGLVEVGVVDLADVAGEDEFRALANAAGDGLDLVRREVLGLVDEHELVGDGAAADVGEGLEHQRAVGDHLVDALLGGVAVGVLVG